MLQVEGLILVDIDEGTVLIPEDEAADNNRKPNCLSSTSSVPNIPAEMATVFKNKWSQLKMQMDLVETIRYSNI